MNWIHHRGLGRLLLALTLIVAVACGEDETTDDNQSNSGNNSGATGKNTVDVSLSDGTTITGSSDTAQPQTFQANVAMGALDVFLLGNDGSIISFSIDMNTYPLPDSVPVGQAVGDPSWLNVTSPFGVMESTGEGTITINSCPSEGGGATVTGSFDSVGLTSVMTAQSSTLSGTFEVIIGLHDGSHSCKDGGEPTESEGPPGCSVATCDGPCCPYVPCMEACQLACMNDECMDLMNPMACMNCMAGCTDECGVTQDCLDPLNDLNQCATTNGCEPALPQESECIGTHCCEEFKAAF